MKSHFASVRRLAVLPLGLAMISVTVGAQQLPVTGQMMDQSTGVGSVAGSAQTSTQTMGAGASERSAAAPSSGNETVASATPMSTRPARQTDVSPMAAVPRHATVIGETTQNLLQMQADGTHSGKPLPILGAEASASYARYMKSFNHDIPEFYKTTVGKNSNNSGGGE